MEKKLIQNPNKDFVRDLKKRIKANNGFCPCQIERNKDTKCPCKLFKEEQNCICGLYIELPEGVEVCDE